MKGEQRRKRPEEEEETNRTAPCKTPFTISNLSPRYGIYSTIIATS
jgi:hypothetical protein